MGNEHSGGGGGGPAHQGQAKAAVPYTDAEMRLERDRMLTIPPAAAAAAATTAAAASSAAAAGSGEGGPPLSAAGAAARRAALLRRIDALPPPVEPLIAATVEPHFLTRREKVTDEVLRHSTVFRPLPENEILKLTATVQTRAMIVGEEAVARNVQFVSDVDACAFQCQLLKSRVIQSTYFVKQVDDCLSSAKALEADTEGVAAECRALPGLIGAIEAMLPEAELAAARSDLRQLAASPDGCFSSHPTPASTPALTPRTVSPVPTR